MCCGPAECHRHAAHCRALAEKDYAFPLRESFTDLAKRWDLLAAEQNAWRGKDVTKPSGSAISRLIPKAVFRGRMGRFGF